MIAKICVLDPCKMKPWFRIYFGKGYSWKRSSQSRPECSTGLSTYAALTLLNI